MTQAPWRYEPEAKRQPSLMWEPSELMGKGLCRCKERSSGIWEQVNVCHKSNEDICGSSGVDGSFHRTLPLVFNFVFLSFMEQIPRQELENLEILLSLM